ncbi:MAG: glutamine--fructose-6-phosphate transaminase (isomerizing) [Candidatus Marinimicrobia bacterium]|nr:glutamine--fructose-6-phosphate transaminase (isomerizing) [Candidatus Neomarinimicrobiota bacterium]
MCGIVGYIGKKNSKEVILKGLSRLEYRGYDSAGIAVHSNGINQLKTSGKVADLDAKCIKEKLPKSSIGIGHTRWATHGIPNDTNAHPHQDITRNFTLVHNGIIENYLTLKKYLAQNGIECKSDTDTEVLVQLISYIYNKDKISFEESVRYALMKVVGAYGIVVLCGDEPDKIIAARHGSPLVFGIGDSEFIIASDTSPIIEFTRKIVYLDDAELVVFTRDDYYVKSILENHIILKTVNEIQFSLNQIEKNGYDHFMLKEINEQSNSIAESMRGRIIIDEGRIKLGGLQEAIQDILNAKRIIITACGTSWHASLIGSFVIEELVRIPVNVEYASEFRYRETIVGPDTVLFAISQSGETADTLAAIKKAKSLGALTIGVVNVVGSSIARETDHGVYIHAGPEIGVASTKAFTSQVTVLNLIAILLAQAKDRNIKEVANLVNDLKLLPEKVELILKQSKKIKSIADNYIDAENFLYLGRGYQFPVALEGALKLKEISYIHAEGYPAAEMKHGPIALIDENMPVVFIVNEKGYEKIISNIQEVRARGGKVIIVTSIDQEELHEYSSHVIHVPSIHQCILPILTTIPLQLLAYYLAKAKGCDVDQPRNLAKSVTVE